MAYEGLVEGELVLCTVERVIGTTVFVRLDGYGEGTITTSEIAPGRIRNIRDYVIPGKKIVCMILNLRGNQINLSLRRVGLNEKKDFLQKVEKERAYKAILRTSLGEEETEKVIEKIREKYSLIDYFNEIKENPKILDDYLKKDIAEKILKILDSKKEKPKEIKEIIRLSSKDSDGLNKVKDIIETSCKNSKCKINYLAAGKYSITISGEDLKKIGNEIKVTLKSRCPTNWCLDPASQPD